MDVISSFGAVAPPSILSALEEILYLWYHIKLRVNTFARRYLLQYCTRQDESVQRKTGEKDDNSIRSQLQFRHTDPF